MSKQTKPTADQLAEHRSSARELLLGLLKLVEEDRVTDVAVVALKASFNFDGGSVIVSISEGAPVDRMLEAVEVLHIEAKQIWLNYQPEDMLVQVQPCSRAVL